MHTKLVIPIIALLLLAGCTGNAQTGGQKNWQADSGAAAASAGNATPQSSGAGANFSGDYKNITAAQLIDALKTKDFFLLDVHVPEQGHINGTDAFAPYADTNAMLAKLPQDKTKKIVVYCRTGRMSEEASGRLAALGYSNIYNVVGGKDEFDKIAGPGNISAEAPQAQKNQQNSLIDRVVPPDGVTLSAKWGDIGPQTIEAGAMSYDSFAAVMERSGRPLTEGQKKILLNGSNENIMINSQNALFVLNLLWAFGLVNNNSAYTDGPMAKYGEQKGNFASTGGWPLGAKPGGELLGSANIVRLTKAQDGLVKTVTSNAYRPCCNNPAYFPDCNHGMAALGLAEIMAAQGASEDEIYSALLYANSYWFTQTYLDMAQYFEEQGKDWESVNPKEALGFEYSSAAGYIKLKQKIKNVPQAPGGYGACGA